MIFFGSEVASGGSEIYVWNPAIFSTLPTGSPSCLKLRMQQFPSGPERVSGVEVGINFGVVESSIDQVGHGDTAILSEVSVPVGYHIYIPTTSNWAES